MSERWERTWIVIAGTPLCVASAGVASADGGFEFFGPFTKDEAKAFRKVMIGRLADNNANWTHVVMAIELLDPSIAGVERDG